MYVHIYMYIYTHMCVYIHMYIYIHILDMTMYVCTSLMIPSPRCSMSLSPIETLTEYAGSVSSWGPKFLIEGKLGMGQHVHPEKMVDLQKITEFGFIVLVKNAASFLTTKTQFNSLLFSYVIHI